SWAVRCPEVPSRSPFRPLSTGLPAASRRSDSPLSPGEAEECSVDIQFIASMAVITPDPERSRALYVSTLGLPLQAAEGDDYLHSEDIDGAKHFGIWPL